MPTLLRNSAAEGYKLGAASHLAELDRNEAARQADLNRYERARAGLSKAMIEMGGENQSFYDEKYVNPKTGTSTPLRDIILDSYHGDIETFAPSDWITTNPDKTFSMKEYRNVNKLQDQRGGVNTRGGY